MPADSQSGDAMPIRRPSGKPLLKLSTNGSLKPVRAKEVRQLPNQADGGMILLDSSFTAIALDQGAASLLAGPDQAAAKLGDAFCLPKELQFALRRCKPSELASLKLRFRLKTGDFNCRVYLLESEHESLSGLIVAVHMQRGVSACDMLSKASAEYHLTDREGEALRGIATGLTSKELAERMNISPNTVKAFVRMIMAKMGVSTRSGIVARLLEHNNG